MYCTVFTATSTPWQALLYTPPLLADNGRIVVYLHGAGGFGTGIEGLFEHRDLPSLLRDGLSLPCRVLIPSCHTSERWTVPALVAFLDDFDAQADETPATYDMVGYSRGGTGAVEFATAYPGRIRTLATIAARGPRHVMASGGTFPVLVVHGRSDKWVPAAHARIIHDAFAVSGHHCELLLTDDDHYLIDLPILQRVFAWQQQW